LGGVGRFTQTLSYEVFPGEETHQKVGTNTCRKILWRNGTEELVQAPTEIFSGEVIPVQPKLRSEASSKIIQSGKHHRLIGKTPAKAVLTLLCFRGNGIQERGGGGVQRLTIRELSLRRKILFVIPRTDAIE